MRKWIIFLMGLFLCVNMGAQDITGVWKTVDENSGKPRSLVKIYQKEGKVYGQIIRLFNEDPSYDPVCKKCPGSLKNNKVKGLQIINGISLDGEIWEGEDGILDPESGKLYDVKIWLEGDKLKVRGYIGFLYRTQTWEREKTL